MRRLEAIVVLSLAVLLLAGCEVSSDSTSAKDGKPSGGILPVLRPHPVTVPEGATLTLVLKTAISSATSRPGDRVVARLAEEVRVGEKVVVPAGSEVRGRVTEAVPSGRVKTRQQQSLQRNYAPFEDSDRWRGSLEDATDDLVRQIIRSNSYLRAQDGQARREQIDGASSFSVVLSGRSPVTGQEERVTVVTRGRACPMAT